MTEHTGWAMKISLKKRRNMAQLSSIVINHDLIAIGAFQIVAVACAISD
jgi:hypothetical protein